MSKNALTKNSNSNQIRVNTLNSLNSSASMANIQNRIGIRRRWESLRRFHQSPANISHTNVTNNINSQTQEICNEINRANQTTDLITGTNNNDTNNNNLARNLTCNDNLGNNANNNNNENTNNNNNNANTSNNTSRNSRYPESPSSVYRRIKRQYYFGRPLNQHFLYQVYGTQGEESNDNYNNNINNNSTHFVSNDNIRTNNLNNTYRFHTRSLSDNIEGVSPNLDNLNKIEEENKKEEANNKEEESKENKEENINSEIKDTVKCYICFDKITKPKMCPHCHRIACDKCLFNWFIKQKKGKCGYCRLKTNYYQMVSVPFMDTVVTFVEKFFNKNADMTETIDKDFLEYCPKHKNEVLYYYCLDCDNAYCKTCFVFFGQEKDKHEGHNIIEYKKYKTMSLPLLKKNTDKLESNIQQVEENIKICQSYKKAYEHEKEIGNDFIKNLLQEFNKQMDETLQIIDDKIKILKEYINEYNKHKKEVDDFNQSIKDNKDISGESSENLIINLTKINKKKIISLKDIEKLSRLSKDICFNTYQSKFQEFNLKNIFLNKSLKMGSSPYEIIIDNKKRKDRKDLDIILKIPKERTPVQHNFKSFILISKKEKGEYIQTYNLDDYKEDDNFYYLKRKIHSDFFGDINIFKLKGILYDFYFS